MKVYFRSVFLFTLLTYLATTVQHTHVLGHKGDGTFVLHMSSPKPIEPVCDNPWWRSCYGA